MDRCLLFYCLYLRRLRIFNITDWNGLGFFLALFEWSHDLEKVKSKGIKCSSEGQGSITTICFYWHYWALLCGFVKWALDGIFLCSRSYLLRDNIIWNKILIRSTSLTCGMAWAFYCLPVLCGIGGLPLLPSSTLLRLVFPYVVEKAIIIQTVICPYGMEVVTIFYCGQLRFELGGLSIGKEGPAVHLRRATLGSYLAEKAKCPIWCWQPFWLVARLLGAISDISNATLRLFCLLLTGDFFRSTDSRLRIAGYYCSSVVCQVWLQFTI